VMMLSGVHGEGVPEVCARYAPRSRDRLRQKQPSEEEEESWRSLPKTQRHSPAAFTDASPRL